MSNVVYVDFPKKQEETLHDCIIWQFYIERFFQDVAFRHKRNHGKPNARNVKVIRDYLDEALEQCVIVDENLTALIGAMIDNLLGEIKR